MLSSLQNISSEQPILIAGPTASGKSALALEIAARHGGVIVNADALQVFANWRVLTARPSDADLNAVPHHLYGHIAGNTAYSVGQWLREVRIILNSGNRPIITGGTGLYFSALTEGLSDIPPTPPEVRQLADDVLASGGIAALIGDIDDITLSKIDRNNPMRVQRAWEVQRSTGRTMAAWQDKTPPPDLTLNRAETMVLVPEKTWLNERINGRFDEMLKHGALDEARANLLNWSPKQPSAKAIGARQLIAHLNGETTLDAARESATLATRQYAKRQRSWFRSRMQAWNAHQLP